MTIQEAIEKSNEIQFDDGKDKFTLRKVGDGLYYSDGSRPYVPHIGELRSNLWSPILIMPKPNELWRHKIHHNQLRFIYPTGLNLMEVGYTTGEGHSSYVDSMNDWSDYELIYPNPEMEL